MAPHPALLIAGRTLALVRPGAHPRTSLVATALALVGAGLVYGAAMGAYTDADGAIRLRQMVYSATKVPLLLVVTFVLCLPAFGIMTTLLGLRADLGDALRALVTAQATLAIVLASLAPYTLLWYASFTDHDAAVLFNGLAFGVASVGAHVVLRRLYRPLIERSARHRVTLWGWLLLYAFVGVQLAWVLRPFVGNPGLPTRFFRENSWSNAYVWIAGAAGRVLW